ncbi:MAG: class I SAM-dependent methyltransferase [Planctomycetota bacterium]|nr:class I SAM-dependent methyltransferase [Planctomycetota bacterium]
MTADSENASAEDACRILRELKATPQIFERLAEGYESELGLQKQLRKDFSSDVVRAAITQTDLRRRAAARFSRAGEMWFSPKGLEQATSEVVAAHKAGRFAGRVYDFCCGIGADSVALGLRGCDVTSVDLSPPCCLMTEWNAEVYGVADRIAVVGSDIGDVKLRDGLLHIDPDRRPGAGQRVRRVEDCEPGLSVLLELTSQFPGGAIKLSPASNFGGKFANCEVELVSLGGECREATIWFGELAGDASFRATVLPSGATLSAEPLSAWTNVGELGAWIYDPDPAVVRSGLVDALAERLGLRRLDDAEEYLTGDIWVDSPFVRPFEVLENLPNNDRDVRRAFGRYKFGEAEIKCRHVPIQAEVVRRKLPMEGQGVGTLIYTRQAGRTKVVICRRFSS